MNLAQYAPDPIGSFLRGFKEGYGAVEQGFRVVNSMQAQKRSERIEDEKLQMARELFQFNLEQARREKEKGELELADTRALPGARQRLMRAAQPFDPGWQVGEADPGANLSPAPALNLGDIQRMKQLMARARTPQELIARGGPTGVEDFELISRRAPATLAILGLQPQEQVEAEARQGQATTQMLNLLKGPRPKSRAEALDLTHQFATIAIEGKLPFAGPLLKTLIDAHTKSPEGVQKLWGDMFDSYRDQVAQDVPAPDAFRNATLEAFRNNLDLFEDNKSAQEFFEKSGLKKSLELVKPGEPKVLGRRLVDPGTGKVIYEAPLEGRNPAEIALAEGLTPGTPKFLERVKQITAELERVKLEEPEKFKGKARTEAFAYLERELAKGTPDETIDRNIQARWGLDPRQVRTGVKPSATREGMIRQLEGLAIKMAEKTFPDNLVKQTELVQWVNQESKGWLTFLGEKEAKKKGTKSFGQKLREKIMEMGGDPKLVPSEFGAGESRKLPGRGQGADLKAQAFAKADEIARRKYGKGFRELAKADAQRVYEEAANEAVTKEQVIAEANRVAQTKHGKGYRDLDEATRRLVMEEATRNLGVTIR